MEELLARTIEVAVSLKLIAKAELRTVIVDSTVQEKAISHPTDSKLLETARAKLVEAAKAQGIELKQTFAKEGQALAHKAAGYNLRWLLRMIAKKGIGPFWRLSGAAECTRLILNWLRRVFDLRINPLPFGGALAEV